MYDFLHLSQRNIKSQILRDVISKLIFLLGALQKFELDARGEQEEKNKGKHEEPGSKEEEGNETGLDIMCFSSLPQVLISFLLLVKFCCDVIKLCSLIYLFTFLIQLLVQNLT